MTYDVSGGERFFYAPADLHYLIMQGAIRMKDKVDRNDLQRAADTTFGLFPFLKSRAVLRDGRYFLETIEEPYIVYEQEEPVVPGSPENGDCLMTVGCWDNLIRNDFYHGLCDGRGDMEFLRHLLYYYCLYHYGGELKCHDILAPGTPPLPEMYAPFDNSLIVPPKHSADLHLPAEVFTLPEKRRAPDKENVVYEITLNQREFIRFSKENDGSPAVIVALLMARAVDEVHPDADRPVAIRMPVDLRGVLKRQQTIRPCITYLELVYSKRLKALPFSRQCTCFRGMVFVQSASEQLVAQYLRESRQMEEILALPTPEERGEAVRSILTGYGPMVSYVGQQNYDDVENYREHFTSLSGVSVMGNLIEIFTTGDNVNISMINALETDAYYRAFLHQLDTVGIKYTVEEPEYFVPLKPCLPRE